MPRIRPKSKHDENVPTFLAKTYDMLEKPENERTIGWSEDGTEFEVRNVGYFTSRVLPRYFKHNNYASFIRQLNMYGFHKVKSESPYQCFKHDRFMRGNRAALKEIKRKAHVYHPIDDGIYYYQPLEVSAVNQELVAMRKKQYELYKVVEILVEQNKQILLDNKHLWNKMKKTIYKYEKKFENIMLLLLFGSKSLSEKPNNELLDDDEQGDSTANKMSGALLPVVEDNKTLHMAVDAIMSQLQNKRKIRGKKKFYDEMFMINQQEHMDIINNLINKTNQLKEKREYNSPLRIEGGNAEDNPDMRHEERQDDPLLLTPIQSIDAGSSPLPLPNESPFHLVREPSDYVDGYEVMNRFLLNRSHDEFSPDKPEELSHDHL